MVELVDHRIDASTSVEQMYSAQAGAVVLFLGTTRQYTQGRETSTLSYECYPEMARQELQRIETAARQRWPIIECLIQHRLGEVPLGEASVLVAVSTPHRAAAFEAAQWIMDTLKQEVPIWKQEHWADGSQQWIHPGSSTSQD